MKSSNRRYSRDHQWAGKTDAGVRVGLTEFAQDELGEITFVQLPQIGMVVNQGDPVCAVDALKAASELYAPVSGTIIAINNRLRDVDEYRLINDDPEDAGWIFELAVANDIEFEELLDADSYRAMITRT